MTPAFSRSSEDATTAAASPGLETTTPPASTLPAPTNLRAAYGSWLFVCLAWGTTYLGIRIALETIPPALVGGIRYTIAGGLLAFVLRVRGEALPTVQHWGGLALLGLLMIGLGNGGVIFAEQWVPSGISAVVVATTPFWANGLEALLPGGERLQRRTLLGLIVGFSGIAFLMWPDLTAGGVRGRQFIIGLVCLQVASLGWSVGSLYGRRRAPQESALGASALQMLFGGLMMLLLATVRGEWADFALSTRSAIAEVYLIVFGSIAGFSAYVYALKHLPLSTVSLYAYVNPVIAVLLGALVLEEPFGWRGVIASALVFSGIAIVKRPNATTKTPALPVASGVGPAAVRRPVAR